MSVNQESNVEALFERMWLSSIVELMTRCTPRSKPTAAAAAFDASSVRVASRNISSAIPCQEYKRDIAGGQSIGDLESHFARELKIERHAV